MGSHMTMNSSGPSTDPWVTPTLMSTGDIAFQLANDLLRRIFSRPRASLPSMHIEERDSYLSLVFESIERDDKGNYTCRGTLNGEAQQLVFKLLVVKPITFGGPLDQQKSISMNANESKAVTVKCEVSGDPHPNVVWQFKGKTLPTDNRYMKIVHGLYINNVSYEDEGIYQCRAFQLTSMSSSMEFRQINLTVNYKPRWIHINSSEQDRLHETAYGYMKGVANITCQAVARPKADYTWTRNNRSLDNLTTNVIQESDRAVLQVQMIDESVLGPYECTANNSLGSIRKVVELHKGDKPSPPIRVSVVSVGLHSAQFHLHAISKDQIIGYRIQYVKRSQKTPIENGDYQDVYTRDGTPYFIGSLEPNTEYSYRVATRNNAGLSDYSPIQVFTSRDVTSSSPGKADISLLIAGFALLALFCPAIIATNERTF
ncbi:Immunoglobulin domain [Nesidiocoris tenuis]|uniref:Immunoglobulin domain n=1 Tax=Nesidiocoris tenuis TaxID=355587 RepID=A0ABN7AA65_9HEMI|nr:Immunoglobulin domain [Nesidiocoris tenuis]